MERALIILCCIFGVACSGKKNDISPEEKNRIPEAYSEKEIVENQTYCFNLVNEAPKPLNVVEVEWMYMDDSLKTLCRPINFRLPLMESDIKILPEFAAIEIAKFRVFDVLDEDTVYTEFLSDSIVRYVRKLKQGACHCEISRSYIGNKKENKFSGYAITEQVICNAVDKK